MSDIHEQLKLLFSVYLLECEKFEDKGIKVSAVRARQTLNEIKSLIPTRRQEIQEQKMDL